MLPTILQLGHLIISRKALTQCRLWNPFSCSFEPLERAAHIASLHFDTDGAFLSSTARRAIYLNVAVYRSTQQHFSPGLAHYEITSRPIDNPEDAGATSDVGSIMSVPAFPENMVSQANSSSRSSPPAPLALNNITGQISGLPGKRAKRLEEITGEGSQSEGLDSPT